MLKYTVLLLNLLGLLFAKVFLPDAVTVSSKAPAEATAGTEFVVELIINKGAVSSFAKLQQDFPEGFAVTVLEAKGASFTFSGGVAKFIWTALPSDQSFKISYKVAVAPNVSGGEKTIGGKFAYVVDNVKQTVDVPSWSITIKAQDKPIVQATAAETKPEEQPAQTTVTTPVETQPAPAETTAAVATQPVTTQPSAMNTQVVSCKRYLPSSVSGEFTVDLTISKGSLVGFAKIQETIPEGFNVVAGETAGASFTFSQNVAKFVWVSLPAQADIKVSYKLVPMGISGAKTIEGLFSYIENDETKKYTIETSTVNIEAAPVVVSNPQSQPEPVVATPAETKPEEQTAQQQPTETATQIVAKESATSASAQETQPAPVTNIPSPQTAVVYRVQICALQKSRVETTYFATRYNLNENVNMEDHEGWTKYTIGSYNEYKPTRDHRESVRSKGVQGPFVTAYNNGKRITVQEALMITSQKWYK